MARPKRVFTDKDELQIKLILPEKVVRVMNRRQYKQIMSWLRYCAREVHKEIDYEAINKAILYGR